jgi:hypothetical protein
LLKKSLPISSAPSCLQMAMNVCYRDEYLVRAQWQAADKTCILPSPPPTNRMSPFTCTLCTTCAHVMTYRQGAIDNGEARCHTRVECIAHCSCRRYCACCAEHALTFSIHRSQVTPDLVFGSVLRCVDN